MFKQACNSTDWIGMTGRRSSMGRLFLNMQSGHCIFYLFAGRHHLKRLVGQLLPWGKSTFWLLKGDEEEILQGVQCSARLHKQVTIFLRMETTKKGHARPQRTLWYFILCAATMDKEGKWNQFLLLLRKSIYCMRRNITFFSGMITHFPPKNVIICPLNILWWDYLFFFLLFLSLCLIKAIHYRWDLVIKVIKHYQAFKRDLCRPARCELTIFKWQSLVLPSSSLSLSSLHEPGYL